MLKRISAVAVLFAMSAAAALAQSTLKPDTTPRLPPQPGQGLPLEDQAFFAHAEKLSAAAIDVGHACAHKGADAQVRAFGEDLIASHTSLLEKTRALAQKIKVTEPPAAVGHPWDADVAALAGLSGESLDRECLRWYWRAHMALADLYQSEASQTPERELATFAIVALAQIQERFDRVKPLGAKYGLKVETLGQPPQY